MENDKKIRVGITQGDTNGIGLEVTLKVLAVPEFMEFCTPVIYGLSKVLTYHRKAIDMPGFQINRAPDAVHLKDGMPNIIEVMGDEEVKVELGSPSKVAGQAAFKALEAAVTDLKQGLIDVLVTAPISKENIQSDEFNFPGQTEYLGASADEGKPLMILCSEDLRVALVTTHLPLAQLSQAITTQGIRERLREFNASLQRDFGIERPRIAVLSLNPHAGENGLLGTEEQTVIRPAIDQAYDEDRITCFGPYAADGFFGSRQHTHFDGVLAMYHDQGLAPFKALAMDSGVNFTAGLPFVRTSPDHGTGYDIAGKGVAREESMRQAIYTAIDIWRNRQRYDEAHANPLRKQYHDRGKDNVVLDLTKDEE